MSRSPFSPEERARIAQEYLDGKGSSYEIAREYGIHNETVRQWARRYAEQGILAFERGNGNTRYSKEFKIKCVELYLTGRMSIKEITAEYNISNHSVLLRWIKKYTSNKELEDYDPHREVYMVEARRKTSKKERLEIVEYCLANGKDYKKTAIRFDVSYAQVYDWVRKYLERGEAGLEDRRGKRKSDEELSELERLRRENQRLKRQLEEERMTVELLKKVKEFERM